MLSPAGTRFTNEKSQVVSEIMKRPQAVSMYPYEEDYEQEDMTSIKNRQATELNHILKADGDYQKILTRKRELLDTMNKFRQDNDLKG